MDVAHLAHCSLISVPLRQTLLAQCSLNYVFYSLQQKLCFASFSFLSHQGPLQLVRFVSILRKLLLIRSFQVYQGRLRYLS